MRSSYYTSQEGQTDPSAPPPYTSSGPATINHHELNIHEEAAKAELKRYGFPDTHKVKVCIALDVSSAMENPNHFYNFKDLAAGKVQTLIDKAMGIAIELSADADHTVTIFPFGAVAFDPVVVAEDNVGTAVDTVMRNIGGELSGGTDYNCVIEKIRQHYFDTKEKLNKPMMSDKAPVFAIFLTDGEPLTKIDEARIQFKASEYNAIFFKFVALKGNQKDLQFNTLKTICQYSNRKLAAPNKHLVVLDDPNDLTIKDLFKYYRTWAEEAHEHGILENDPGFNISIENPDNAEELAFKEKLEEDHGHDEAGVAHGHLNTGNKPHYQSTNRYGQFNAKSQQNVRPQPAADNVENSNCMKCTIL
jgi:uncharacterized protein YegL